MQRPRIEAVLDVLRQRGKPACFDTQDEYDGWLRAAADAPITADNRRWWLWCVDCKPSYQAEMAAAGRCAMADWVSFTRRGGAVHALVRGGCESLDLAVGAVYHHVDRRKLPVNTAS